MRLLLVFAQIDAALAARHRIADQKRSSFQARLKNFHRLNFPPGIGAGRGKAAQYSSDDYLKIVVAAELLAKGFNPAPVVKLVEWNWSWIQHSIFESLVEGHPEKTLYWITNVPEFGELTKKPRDEFEYLFEFATVAAGQLADLLNGRATPPGRISEEAMFVLDVGAILKRNVATLSEVLGEDETQVVKALVSALEPSVRETRIMWEEENSSEVSPEAAAILLRKGQEFNQARGLSQSGMPTDGETNED